MDLSTGAVGRILRQLPRFLTPGVYALCNLLPWMREGTVTMMGYYSPDYIIFYDKGILQM